MQKGKTLKMLIVIIIVITNSIGIVYADDEISEDSMSKKEIEDIIETTTSINDIPNINSRHAIIYDRASRYCIIWKR